MCPLFLALSTVAPPPLQCITMAAQLLCLMRGRGSAEHVARRLELGEKLAGQARVMLQLEQRGTASIPWWVEGTWEEDVRSGMNALRGSHVTARIPLVCKHAWVAQERLPGWAGAGDGG